MHVNCRKFNDLDVDPCRDYCVFLTIKYHVT